MKRIVFVLLVAAGSAASADEIHFRNGTAVKCRVAKVDERKIDYTADLSRFSVERSRVARIVYDDGSSIVFNGAGAGIASADAGAAPVRYVNPYADKAHRDLDSCGCSFPEIRKFDTAPSAPLLLPVPLEIGGQKTSGKTDVKIFDGGKNKIASGRASFVEYRGGITPAGMDSRWLYVSPEIGYFYRKLGVHDFAGSVNENQSDALLPGVITDPSTGAEISRSSVESIRYDATFHSAYLDAKVGSRLLFGTPSVIWSLNPFIGCTLFELNKSDYLFRFNGQSERFSSGLTPAFLSSVTGGMELGVYFPGIHVGFRCGWEYTRYFKFKVPGSVKFNENYYDSSKQLTRTREVSVKYSEVSAGVVSLSAFCWL